jgi:four helix bundle protein
MHFRELLVWQKSKKLAVDVYLVIKSGPLARDFGLRDQIQRSVVSIPSNIAEGYTRATANDRCHFFTIAKGSCAELQTQLEIARDADLLASSHWTVLDQQCEEVSRMITGFMKTLRPKSS